MYPQSWEPSTTRKCPREHGAQTGKAPVSVMESDLPNLEVQICDATVLMQLMFSKWWRKLQRPWPSSCVM